MRILYYSASYGALTTIFIRNETEYFNKEHQVKFICHYLYDHTVIPGYVDFIPFEENSFLKSLRWRLWKMDLKCTFKNKKYAIELNKHISDFKPDIIHCHFGYDALMLLDNIEDIGKYPIIVHFHGFDATEMTRKKSYVRRLNKYLSLKNVFTITCNSFFLNRLKNELNIPINQGTVIWYGIDAKNLFVPKGSPVKPPLLVQFSSLQEKKGHEYTLQAFKNLIADPEYKDVKLILTGEGERRDFLQAMVEQLHLDNNVTFLNYLTPPEIAFYLNEASVFVHHSITSKEGDMEGMPNSILEAMAMELPVVSTWHSGIPELVEDGVNGYLVKEKDVDAYTEAMKKALKMGRLKVSRDKILSQYSVERHNNQVMDYYLKCIEATKRKS